MYEWVPANSMLVVTPSQPGIHVSKYVETYLVDGMVVSMFQGFDAIFKAIICGSGILATM